MTIAPSKLDEIVFSSHWCVISIHLFIKVKFIILVSQILLHTKSRTVPVNDRSAFVILSVFLWLKLNMASVELFYVQIQYLEMIRPFSILAARTSWAWIARVQSRSCLQLFCSYFDLNVSSMSPFPLFSRALSVFFQIGSFSLLLAAFSNSQYLEGIMMLGKTFWVHVSQSDPRVNPECLQNILTNQSELRMSQVLTNEDWVFLGRLSASTDFSGNFLLRP